MNIDEIVKNLLEEVSRNSIMNMVSRLTHFHRVQASKEYFKAALYIRSILEENGLPAILYEFPADGKWEKWGWIAPISWDIKSGECWMIKPKKKKISSYKEIPMSVITHSKPADFKAPLVDIGEGSKVEDYEEARDKIALITASPRRIFSFAAKHNVKGLILHPNQERAAKIGDSTVQYDGFWPIHENLHHVTSGFSISHHQARELQQYLKNKQEIMLHFKIDAEFSTEEGLLHVLETEIVGSDQSLEEIVLIGHLCHPSPSANDNASGSATLVETVLSLSRLIDRGDLPQPKKTIRFLWVPEFSGTIPWLTQFDSQQEKRTILAALNLDMVGESPVKIGTPLKISSPSLATPSYLKALVKNIAQRVSKNNIGFNTNGRWYQLKYEIEPFAGGSDHFIFNDTYFSIPSVMFGHNDLFHHSSADSIDKVDPWECKSVATIAGSIAFALASINEENTILKEILYFAFMDGLYDVIQHELSLDQSTLSVNQKMKQTELLEKHILKQMESIRKLDPTNNFIENLTYFSKVMKSHFSQIRNQLKIIQEAKEQEKVSMSDIRIKRNYAGPISFRKLMRAYRSIEDEKSLATIIQDYWGGPALELLNLASGRYTIEEIFLLLKTQYPNVTLNAVISLVKQFQKEAIIATL